MVKIKQRASKVTVSLVAIAWLMTGWPPILQQWLPKAHALTAVSVQTGYYMGDGSSAHSITGLGFAPEFVLVNAGTGAGSAAFATSAMPSNHMAFVAATSNNTASNLVLDADGFTVGTNASVNSLQVRYTWIAFAGSDCSSNGIMCIGQYTGDGSSPRDITTGFQPDFVMVKRTTSVAAHFHTASQPTDETLYVINTVRDTSGNYIQSFSSSAFSVGSSDNVSGGTYNFIAFRNAANTFAEGTYNGNGSDNRDISGFGFTPNIAIVKNATNTTANNTDGIMNTDSNYGDFSSVMSAAPNDPNYIQALQTDGIQVGTHVRVNGASDTYYWLAFGGVPPNVATPGTQFEMANGSYTGNGTSQGITGVGFQPDLVIIKDEAANYQVFRTGLMRGDLTLYFANTAAGFTGAITSLDSNGFSVGAHVTTNASGNTYHWQAFGGAWNPETKAGSTDFTIGAYVGSGTDDRNITGLPWQPDMVTVKRDGNSNALWRSSAQSGDVSGQFGSISEFADRIQSLNADGFQLGTSILTNALDSPYYWFAFKNGNGFTTGNYTGNDTDNRNITGLGFQPDLVWVKRNAGFPAVSRPASLTGDSTQYFLSNANVSDRIQSLISDGFQVGGNQSETNKGGATYRYMAWRNVPPTVISLTITTDGTVNYGTVAAGASKSTIDVSDTQTVENDGNVAEDFNIKSDEPAGWTLGSSAGTDTFVHEFSTNSGANWTLFSVADSYQSFITNIAASASQNFDLRLTVPTQSTDSSQKTVTITLQAVEH